jgi:GNAT superfamily N-acetyltransferase
MVSRVRQLTRELTSQPSIRPLDPQDLSTVRAMFDRVSDEAVYRRFFTGGPSGPRSELDYLAAVDGHDRLALVAVAGGRTVGLARYHRTGDGHADVAVIVEDAWQHHGVGRRLLSELVHAARGEGVVSLDMTILGENVPALRLLRRLAPWRQLRLDHGVFEASVGIAG